MKLKISNKKLMQTMLEFGMKFMSFEKHKSAVAVEKHKSAKRSKT